MQPAARQFVSAWSAAILLCVSVVHAEDLSSSRLKLGEQTTSQWRFGIVVKAPGAVNGIVATMAVPSDFPEQKVKIIKEEISPQVKKVSYRDLGGVKQLVVSIPRLAAGDEASVIVTFEITKSEIVKPDDISGLSSPAKPTKDLTKYLAPSPYIESTDPKIKHLAPTIVKDKADVWEKVEAIFDYVQANVKYEFSSEIHPAIDALNAGKGDCEELTSLFIAFCRANKIPARAVWVPGHCYPEFYLQDSQGRGTWFPCQAAGDGRIFGWMDEERPILQKGDNFKTPEEKGPQRYVKQFLKATNAEANPEIRFVLERVQE